MDRRTNKDGHTDKQTTYKWHLKEKQTDRIEAVLIKYISKMNKNTSKKGNEAFLSNQLLFIQTSMA
jgi:hypothetical protein